MWTTMWKLSCAVCLCMILLICAGLLPGCGEQDKSQDTSGVRQPAAGEDLEAFWNGFDWKELTSEEQTLWGVLGWNEASWQGEADKPASESEKWSGLTSEERSAAEKLGYDEAYWDSLP